MSAKKVVKLIKIHNFKIGMITRVIYRLLANIALRVKPILKKLKCRQ